MRMMKSLEQQDLTVDCSKCIQREIRRDKEMHVWVKKICVSTPV